MPHEPLNYESRQLVDAGRCPFCGSPAVVTGKLGGDTSVGFVPDNLKSFAWTFTPPGVLLQGPAFACTDCGAVWSQADAARLREVLARWVKGDGV